MQADTLSGGFDSPSIAAARTFRSVMLAMARPGTIHPVGGTRPPTPMSPAAGAVLLTLCDADTPVHLAGDMDTAALRTWLAFHTGAPIVGPSHCMFALGTWDALAPFEAYPIGTPAYPDRSATLIVERPALTAKGARLQGPGIRTEAALEVPDVMVFRRNRALFPLGLDFILTAGDRMAALPRTTEVS